MKPLLNLSDRHQAALLSASWFAALPRKVKDDVIAHCRMRTYAEHERVHTRGEKADCFYIVLEGCLRFSGVGGNERLTVLDFYGPGTWLGEVPALAGGPRMYDADAYVQSVVLLLSFSDLNKLLDNHPSLCRGLLRLVAERLRIVLTAIEQYSIQPLESRLATRFLMLSKSFGAEVPEGIQIDLHLPQETLAQLIGSTRQRVNQILLDWEESSLIRQKYGRTIILDPSRLEQMSDG